MSKQHTDVMKIIEKARTILLLDYPFFGALALPLDTIIDETIPTACTNGRSIRYNPNFVKKLSPAQVIFLVAHEVCHPMFWHLTRRGSRDPMRWNIAGDIVINHMLIEDKVGEFIQGSVHMPDLHAQGNGSTDAIYNLLPEDCGGGGGGGGIGQDLDEGDGGMSEEEKEAMESEWQGNVARAAQQAKMMGKLSAGLARLVDEYLNPKLPWHVLLQRFVIKCRVDQRTWARPSRRFASQGLYMPSITGEQMGPVIIGVDCSGSIGANELAQFAPEIRTIWVDQRPVEMHVIYFDSRVCHVDTFTPGDDFHIEAHGGGGTAFSPIFEYVNEHSIEPVCGIVLTDLYCSDFGPEPDYPVLWVSNGATEAPWGEVVKM